MMTGRSSIHVVSAIVLAAILVVGVWLALSGPGRSSAARADPVEPPAGLVSLCSTDEPGERLQFWGRVLDYQGRPLEKASVVAYHTDRTGLYNPRTSDTRVPRIRGVAVTDSAGRFGFSSIRPAAYPNATEPAHIHLVVSAPAHHVKYMDIWFDGDPLVTAEHRRRASTNPSLAIVVLDGSAGAGWTFNQNIRLESN